MKLNKIFNFINKNSCFVYTLATKFLCSYIKEKYELNNNIEFNYNFVPKFVLPKYVFDKHTLNTKDKFHSFFINNIILIPRREETNIEKKAKKIFIKTNNNTGYWLEQKKEENFNTQLTGNLIQT